MVLYLSMINVIAITTKGGNHNMPLMIMSCHRFVSQWCFSEFTPSWSQPFCYGSLWLMWPPVKADNN